MLQFHAGILIWDSVPFGDSLKWNLEELRFLSSLLASFFRSGGCPLVFSCMCVCMCICMCLSRPPSGRTSVCHSDRSWQQGLLQWAHWSSANNLLATAVSASSFFYFPFPLCIPLSTSCGLISFLLIYILFLPGFRLSPFNPLLTFWRVFCRHIMRA